MDTSHTFLPPQNTIPKEFPMLTMFTLEVFKPNTLFLSPIFEDLQMSSIIFSANQKKKPSKKLQISNL